MLIAQGESAKYVCDQMGHSSIQVTFGTYGHLFPNSRATAAKEAATGDVHKEEKWVWQQFGSKTRKTREKEAVRRERRMTLISLKRKEEGAENFWLRGKDLNI
jgi:hypothetical protein